PHTPPRSFSAAGLPTGHERNRPASPSSAPCRTTAARPFPDCTPPSETCPSCPCTAHRHPSAAGAVAAVGLPTAPGTAGRWLVPCSPPAPFVGLLAAPPHSRTPVPPRPRSACCMALCSAAVLPSPPSLRSPGNESGRVQRSPLSETRSTADP